LVSVKTNYNKSAEPKRNAKKPENRAKNKAMKI
jgi:hypothetical protein